MKPEQCLKLDACPKIKMILDKESSLTFSMPKPSGQSMLSVTRVTAMRGEVVKLRQVGLSYAEIARRLGITREQMRRITKEKPTPQKPDLGSNIMLTTSDVAQLLGLHSNTVRRWNAKGILKSYRIGPRRDRRFGRGDIDSFLKEAESAKGGDN